MIPRGTTLPTGHHPPVHLQYCTRYPDGSPIVVCADGAVARFRLNWFIQSSPKVRLAARSLCIRQSRRRFFAVVGPSRARAMAWSNSIRRVDPQTPPDSSGHWQRPPSLNQTSRFTAAGTAREVAMLTRVRGFSTMPFRLACRFRMRSRPVSRTLSVAPPGCECESAARAASSFSRNRFDTVTWRRANSPVSGCAESARGGLVTGGAEALGFVSTG